MWPANTDADAGYDICPERGEDGLQPAMSGRSTSCSDPDSAQWQVQIIVDDEQILQPHLVAGDDGFHDAATPIHVGEGFEQNHRLSLDRPASQETLEFEAVKGKSVALRKSFEDGEAHIVPVSAVFGTRVPQADDQLGSLHHSVVALTDKPSQHDELPVVHTIASSNRGWFDHQPLNDPMALE